MYTYTCILSSVTAPEFFASFFFFERNSIRMENEEEVEEEEVMLKLNWACLGSALNLLLLLLHDTLWCQQWERKRGAGREGRMSGAWKWIPGLGSCKSQPWPLALAACRGACTSTQPETHIQSHAIDTHTYNIHAYIYISKLSQLVGHYGKAVVVVVVVAVSACHECPVADNNNNNNNSNT